MAALLLRAARVHGFRRSHHPRGRRQIDRAAESRSGVLRRRRAELRLHAERQLIADQGKLAPKRVYFRAHNLPDHRRRHACACGDRRTYTRTPAAVYDWTIVDRIFDTYLERGVKPYADRVHAEGDVHQARALSAQVDAHGEIRRDLHGLVAPPQDYAKWGARASGRNTASRKTGRKSSSGYSNLERGEHRLLARHAGGVQKLHDYAIAGVRRALPTARVGGPDTAGSGGQWMRDFLEHQLRGKNFATGQTGTPIDFVSFHAKAGPSMSMATRMGISNQLATIDDGFRIIALYPELKSKPIVIGESDPEGARPARDRSCSTATRRCIRATRRRASRGSTIWPIGMA